MAPGPDPLRFAGDQPAAVESRALAAVANGLYAAAGDGGGVAGAGAGRTAYGLSAPGARGGGAAGSFTEYPNQSMATAGVGACIRRRPCAAADRGARDRIFRSCPGNLHRAGRPIRCALAGGVATDRRANHGPCRSPGLGERGRVSYGTALADYGWGSGLSTIRGTARPACGDDPSAGPNGCRNHAAANCAAGTGRTRGRAGFKRPPR